MTSAQQVSRWSAFRRTLRKNSSSSGSDSRWVSPSFPTPTRQHSNAYGAYGEKLLYGKLVEGVIRSTFVIDVDSGGSGTVALAQYNVKATGHVDKLKRDLAL